MDKSCQENEEPHYSSIQSVYSESRTRSDGELTGTRVRDQFSRRTTSLGDANSHQSSTTTSCDSKDSSYDDVDIHVLSRSINALTVLHRRHNLSPPFNMDTSFPDPIVSGHDECLCCNRGRKWVCWRMEMNKQLADSVLNFTQYNGGMRTWEVTDRPRGCQTTKCTNDSDATAGGETSLCSHQYFMYGIPRARLHTRLRH